MFEQYRRVANIVAGHQFVCVIHRRRMHGEPIYDAHVIVVAVDEPQLRHRFVGVVFVPEMQMGMSIPMLRRRLHFDELTVYALLADF